ncbi:hypothetical protein Lal_00033255 [Lupinus albus]|uniref:Uncharacterized protein n=1 Tax=Lupinus albus TaxID=3870 RepID=A0A6A4QF65_LUPAL|nr:hypothetical protein Lalb_Chr06g0173561 [Lupinus albus]KAF1879598.1 hypothetical protein Lal_00033255 [Lupinus albus]
MNHYNFHEIDLISLEEMRDSSTIYDTKGTVFCPKPLRVMVFPDMPLTTRSSRMKFYEQSDGSDSKDLAEIVDIILEEGYCINHEPSSPPYFLGSPPIRATNPLIQDDKFGYGKNNSQPIFSVSSSPSLTSSPLSTSLGLSSPSSSPWRKGGCVRTKFGIKSTPVRVVGFDCNVHAVA